MRPTDRAAVAVGADAAAGRLRCGAECLRRGGFRPPGCPFPWDLLHHRRRPCDDGRAVGDAAAGGGDGGGDATGDQVDREYRSRASNLKNNNNNNNNSKNFDQEIFEIIRIDLILF
jgi:hypothetical protein